MADIYAEMITAAQEIAASFPLPRFYTCCGHWIHLSRSLFSEDENVSHCRVVVERELKDNYGHGLEHADKVAIEGGALVFIEGLRLSWEESAKRRAGILAQMAGLLHDLRREEKEHARSSAEAAGKILEEFSLPPAEVRVVVEAIANHEAFVIPQRVDSALGQLVSDVLYDADKFRWGPDNFTWTLWEMMRFSQAPIVRLIPRFPKGMKGIARIKDTFRTETGRIYGPEFIDLGLQIGERIYLYLQKRFAAELHQEKKDRKEGREDTEKRKRHGETGRR